MEKDPITAGVIGALLRARHKKSLALREKRKAISARAGQQARLVPDTKDRAIGSVGLDSFHEVVRKR